MQEEQSVCFQRKLPVIEACIGMLPNVAGTFSLYCEFKNLLIERELRYLESLFSFQDLYPTFPTLKATYKNRH